MSGYYWIIVGLLFALGILSTITDLSELARKKVTRALQEWDEWKKLREKV